MGSRFAWASVSIGIVLLGVVTAGPARAQCEWCGAPEAPDSLGSEATITGPDEDGTPLVVSGTVYLADGETPAPGVLLYVYHTNSKGVYPKRGDETGNGRRHGYLRAWLRTDDEGRYRFTTIKPEPYPSRSGPAHIHMTVTPPGGEERWVDSIWFEGDPLITPALRNRLENRGGSGIVTLEEDEEGVLHATRDVVLEP